jgi:hypothetical protein
LSARTINTLAIRLAKGVVLACLVGCTRVPVRDIYCDGSARWTCRDPAFPTCDVIARQCVARPADMALGDMELPSPLDLARPDLVAACHGAGDCPATRPICDGNGRCHSCAGSSDDGACAQRSPSTPRCLTSVGMCAACSTPGAQTSDCSAATPICNSDGTCRSCVTHDECTSRICNLDGTCVSPGSVAYAGNNNGSCSGAHAASAADPACEISAALAVQPVVRVFASTVAYARLTLASGTVRIVGPGLLASPTAMLSGDLSNPAVTISGATTNVTLDGLEVSGGGTGQDGIFCSQASLGPSLTMLRSWVHGVGGAGIDATKCDVILDRDMIGPGNAGGGLVLTSARYSIINSFFAVNGVSGAGVTFNAGATALPSGFGFMHNTIVKNSGGGILCGAVASIVSSIVWGNSGTDTMGSCTLTGSTSLAPDFVSAGGPGYDFHLAGRTVANMACCIDQIATSPVDHDYDGRKRPQGVKWDVGAHEVP